MHRDAHLPRRGGAFSVWETGRSGLRSHWLPTRLKCSVKVSQCDGEQNPAVSRPDFMAVLFGPVNGLGSWRFPVERVRKKSVQRLRSRTILGTKRSELGVCGWDEPRLNLYSCLHRPCNCLYLAYTTTTQTHTPKCFFFHWAEAVLRLSRIIQPLHVVRHCGDEKTKTVFSIDLILIWLWKEEEMSEKNKHPQWVITRSVRWQKSGDTIHVTIQVQRYDILG